MASRAVRPGRTNAANGPAEATRAADRSDRAQAVASHCGGLTSLACYRILRGGALSGCLRGCRGLGPVFYGHKRGLKVRFDVPLKCFRVVRSETVLRKNVRS